RRTDTSLAYTTTLSLHDALPICPRLERLVHDDGADPAQVVVGRDAGVEDANGHKGHEPRLAGLDRAVEDVDLRDEASRRRDPRQDRKSTRLNSSHVKISYAVFCL